MPDNACREASERRAEAQGLLGVAERNAQLTADLATAQERALQLQERAEAMEQALEERDAAEEAEQLLRQRVNANDVHQLSWLRRGSAADKLQHEQWAMLRSAVCQASGTSCHQDTKMIVHGGPGGMDFAHSH